jgi:integrase
MPRLSQNLLTDRQVRAAKPGPKPVDIRDGSRGLVLTVLPSGRKQFAVRYTFGGKHRRLVLGDFPALTLSNARAAAEEARTAVRHAHDPVAERRAARAPRQDTVAALAADYLKRHALPNKRSAAEDERVIDKELLPRLGDRSVRTLTRRDIRDVLDRVVDRGSPVMANRVLAVIRKMLNFGVDHDWLDANPAARISKPTRETSRDRVLTEDEIRALWHLLDRQPTTADRAAPGRPSKRRESEDDPLCPVSGTMAAVIKARLLTAQRGGEVARMRWEDVDLSRGIWTIPATETKNSEAHRVPLTSDMVALIAAQAPDASQRYDYVFSGRFGNLVTARARKASVTLSRTLGFDFRGHDLRRTAATGMAAAGIPREYIARVLNHVDGGARATRVYDRHTYDAEKRFALEAWQRELHRILAGAPRSAVIPFAHRLAGVG